MRAVNTYRPATGICATTPPSNRVVSSASGYGPPVGVNTADGTVPPRRCSHIAPPVANSVRPVPSLQNTRGRTMALEYPREIGPAGVVDVVALLPVPADAQRSA